MRVYLECISVGETARGYSRPAMLTYSVPALVDALERSGCMSKFSGHTDSMHSQEACQERLQIHI